MGLGAPLIGLCYMNKVREQSSHSDIMVYKTLVPLALKLPCQKITMCGWELRETSRCSEGPPANSQQENGDVSPTTSRN